MDVRPNSKGLDDLYDGLKKGIIANRMFAVISDGVRDISNGNMTVDQIEKINADESFYRFFPSLEEPIEEFNNSIFQLKNVYGRVKKQTKKILSKRLVGLNNKIHRLGIPYTITAEYKNKSLLMILFLRLMNLDDREFMIFLKK